jgi:hypothetical protein
MKSSHLTILAGFSLLFPALFVYFKQTGFDNIFYPYPVLVFIPMFFGLRWASFAVPTMLFFAWNPGLFRGDAEVPRRSYVLLLIATVANVLWMIVNWKYGLAVQGAKYSYSVCLVNVAWAALLFVMFTRSQKERSFKTNLLLHWILFAWFAWYAFPFFGEFL